MIEGNGEMGAQHSGARIPPHSAESERGVLGSLLLEPDRVMPHCLRMGVRESWFYVPSNREVFAAIEELVASGGVVDTIQLCAHLGGPALERIGGAQALDALIDATPTAAHAEHYIATVRDRWLKREVVSQARELERLGFDDSPGDELLERARTLFDVVGVEGDVEERTNEQELDEAYDNIENGTELGLEVPFAALNAVLCGLEPGLTLLAGRPSAGKTTLEDIISNSVAEAGGAVLRFTMDSTRRELMLRSACRRASVSLPKLKRARVEGYTVRREMQRMRDARDVIAQLPMTVDESARDIEEICARIRVRNRNLITQTGKGLALVTLDYVQLVRAGALGRGEYDENGRITYVSSALKHLSFELKVPFLILSQLKRGPAKSSSAPELSDLRGSGALEQDASKVLLLSQEMEMHEMMEGKSPKVTRKLRPIWCEVAKHKNGECGTMELWFMCSYFQLEEAPPEWADWGARVDDLAQSKSRADKASSRVQSSGDTQGVDFEPDDELDF